MKTWIRPAAYEECYASNENIANSVTACYKIACNVGRPNDYATNYSNGPYWSGREYGGVWHENGGTGNCSDANSNRVLSNGMKEGSSIQEYNSDQKKWLNGKIDNIIFNADGQVGPGATVYWYTTSGNRRWNHKGTIELADAGHPNHS